MLTAMADTEEVAAAVVSYNNACSCSLRGETLVFKAAVCTAACCVWVVSHTSYVPQTQLKAPSMQRCPVLLLSLAFSSRE